MHISVLKEEVIRLLNPQKNENFIDATVGNGGHAMYILEKTAPNGKLLGIDWDETQIKNLKEKLKIFEGRILLVCENFKALKAIVIREKFNDVAGILFDFGMSSWHLEESKRGFSFQKNEPLDMRYNLNDNFLTAKEIINSYSEKDLERIFRDYGGERFAKSIAGKIIESRKVKSIQTTNELKEIIKMATPSYNQRKKIHFATKIFQALRIEANQELANLEEGIKQGFEVLKNGGRLAAISFHSLEDKIIKNFFKKMEKEKRGLILTKKPVTPRDEEIRKNPRARSAKIRAILKI